MSSQGASCGSDALLYAIGDVHGRCDLVIDALRSVERHAGSRAHRIIFLGDYIDRGPRSCETVELLMARERTGSVICLKGNHEDLLVRLRQTHSRRDFDAWIELGGGPTLASYGARSFSLSALSEIPCSHVLWMAGLPTRHEEDQHVFVHAGMAPQVALADQRCEDLLWIRDRFLRSTAERFVERRHIVHGHTPHWDGKPHADRPELLSHRTNLDTGAYLTGVLAIGVFISGREGGPIDLLGV